LPSPAPAGQAGLAPAAAPWRTGAVAADAASPGHSSQGADADQLAQLKAEVARYANAVERVRDLVRALRLASVGTEEHAEPDLYWPHLLEVLEGVLPGE
jgi:hypothetical protein